MDKLKPHMTESESLDINDTKSSIVPATVPATAIPLTGQHLIEASAGTGKTWTLTGIVLRLLIEAKRPPEQIICTTFTRAAAAEMRERIMGRLQSFYQLLLWLDKLSSNPECQSWMYAVLESDIEKARVVDAENSHSQQNVFSTGKVTNKANDEFQFQREKKLRHYAKQSGHDATEDLVNLHLMHYVLNHYQDYPLSMVIRRTQLLLISMDKLFVGTLDSLAQKWLGEYSAETGYQKGMSISEHETEMINDIIHDELRKFQARTYANNPKLYQMLEKTGKLTEVSDHIQTVNKAMQFISAPIDKPKGFDFDFYQSLIEQMMEENINDVLPYFDSKYRKSQGLNGRTTIAKLLPCIQTIVDCIREHQVFYFLHLDAESQKFITAFPAVFLDPEQGGKGFNKGKDNERNTFINLPTIQRLRQLIDTTQTLDDEVVLLNYHIAQTVRHRLPIQLEENNQTTFGLQMVRLNQALLGRQGQKLARYIRHHYPIALIDESQDINGEQVKMIRSIYLNHMSRTQNHHANLLLLVGDPKQAIYGFRGGDVANYNAMKTLFNDPMTLTMNRRSNTGVIASLNEWFGCGRETEREPLAQAQLGDGIYYQRIEAFRQASELSWQQDTYKEDDDSMSGLTSITPAEALSIIHLPYYKPGDEGPDKYQVLAHHIQYLLQSNQTRDNRPIIAQDIAVLAKTKADLQKAQWALQKLGIATVKPADVSVFASQMAGDLLAVLQAVQNPYHTGYVNRALTTALYGLSLAQVKTLEYAENGQSNWQFSYHDFQQHLQTAEQLWSDYGVLSAIQYLLADCLFYQKNTHFSQSTVKEDIGQKTGNRMSIWEMLASQKHAERHLLDLRQLIDLLAANTRHLVAVEVLDWLALQRQNLPTDENSTQQQIPTESGVKLMTIHKSKGLEFPIVYVLGMDSSAKKITRGYDLFPYIQTLESGQTQRQLSAVATDSERDYQAIVNLAELSEAKRVGYVALTRASEQVYMLLQDNAQNRELDFRPANIWLDCDDKTYQLPKRLSGYVGWIEADWIMNTSLQKYKNMRVKENSSENHLARLLIKYQDYHKVIKKTYFIGWSKTSFTALSRQLDKHHEDVAIYEPDYTLEDESVINPLLDRLGNTNEMTDLVVFDKGSNAIAATITEDDIRFRFVRGAGAGTFLHQVLEKMDFDTPQTWSDTINKAIMQYNLPAIYKVNEDTSAENKHDELKQWLTDVLHSPLQASQKKLIDIPMNKRKAELAFDMGLSDKFRVEHINQVLRTHLGENSDKLLSLATKNNQHYRYLRGEIDLVYEDEGKFYVVDYKSNYLGNRLEDYHPDNLSLAMSKAGYWLQALIYQVALHRFLKLRIADYTGNESKYLGAVEYVFLRGCVSQRTIADDKNTISDISTDMNEKVLRSSSFGKITWDIPVNLVLDLNKVFG